MPRAIGSAAFSSRTSVESRPWAVVSFAEPEVSVRTVAPAGTALETSVGPLGQAMSP